MARTAWPFFACALFTCMVMPDAPSKRGTTRGLVVSLQLVLNLKTIGDHWRIIFQRDLILICLIVEMKIPGLCS